jgi:hypothetical protein
MAEEPWLGIAAVLFDKLANRVASDPKTIDPMLLYTLGGVVTLCGGPFWKTALTAYSIEPGSGEETPGPT